MRTRRIARALALALALVPSLAAANNSRLGLHVIRIEPNGTDAKEFSEAAWGGNIEVIAVPPGTWDALAFSLGFEGVRLDSKTVEFRDRVTGLRVEQQTNQDYFRIFLGGRIGHQGHGFFRPYAGANIALNLFTIKTDVVIPDDTDRQNEIRQNLDKKTEAAFGFDTALGIELNFDDAWYIDVGGKFIKTFNVPQQLGDEAKTIHPQYFEIYAGAGITFEFIASH